MSDPTGPEASIAGTSGATRKAGWRLWFAGFALAAAIASVAWFALAALGSQWGWWHWSFGLLTMMMAWGPIVSVGAVALSVLALIIALIASPRLQPFILGLAALLISGSMLGRLAGQAMYAQSVPPIHDIQTNWDAPLPFSETLMAVRKADGARNPVEPAPVLTLDEAGRERWPGVHGKTVAQLQEAAEFNPDTMSDRDEAPYPYAIETLGLGLGQEAAYDLALEIARKRGWEIVTADRDNGIIEATETSPWFGFKDDVAIHVTGANGAASVDMRSVSRVGLSDLGANAKRVAGFLVDLEQAARRKSSAAPDPN